MAEKLFQSYRPNLLPAGTMLAPPQNQASLDSSRLNINLNAIACAANVMKPDEIVHPSTLILGGNPDSAVASTVAPSSSSSFLHVNGIVVLADAPAHPSCGVSGLVELNATKPQKRFNSSSVDDGHFWRNGTGAKMILRQAGLKSDFWADTFRRGAMFHGRQR